MSLCPALGSDDGVLALGALLRAIDCRTSDTVAYSFGHLFGVHGRLMPALTGILTLYIAFFGMGLLTGRSRLGLSALTPRMLTLGLVLTFATSWAAYQNIVWMLATGAPDQVAALVSGTHGSATAAFADKFDALFKVVDEAADQASVSVAPNDPSAPVLVGGFTVSTVLQACALLLLLSTAGVLITAKIALAALLGVGPLFVVFVLFTGTRGLFEGWLKAVVMVGLVPLFSVLLGGGAISVLLPMAQRIAVAGRPEPRDIAGLFLGSVVYCALLAMALRTAGIIIATWHPLGRRPIGATEHAPHGQTRESAPSFDGMRLPSADQRTDERIRHAIAGLPAGGDPVSAASDGARARDQSRVAQILSLDTANVRPASTFDRRIQGIGSRFHAPSVGSSQRRVS